MTYQPSDYAEQAIENNRTNGTLYIKPHSSGTNVWDVVTNGTSKTIHADTPLDALAAAHEKTPSIYDYDLDTSFDLDSLNDTTIGPAT